MLKEEKKTHGEKLTFNALSLVVRKLEMLGA